MLSLAATRILNLLRQHGRRFVDRHGNRRLKLQASWRQLQQATGTSAGTLGRALKELEGAVGLLHHRSTRRDLPGALSIPDPEMAELSTTQLQKVEHPGPASQAQKVIHRGGPPDFTAEGGVLHPVMSSRSHGPTPDQKGDKIPSTPVHKSAPNGWGMGGSTERHVHHHPSGEGPGGPLTFAQSGAPSGRRAKLAAESYPQSGAPPKMRELLYTNSGIFILDEEPHYLQHPPEVVESMARQLEGWGFSDALRFCRKYPLEIILEEMNEIRREIDTGSRIVEPGAVLRKRVKERCDG